MRAPRGTRRAALTAGLALVLPLAALAAPVDDAARGQPPPRPATPTAPAVEAVERVERRGAPVAVLRGATELRDGPRGRVVARLGEETEWGSPRVLAVVGARGAWLEVIATELPNGRTGWIALAAADLSANPWRMRADLSSRSVEVLRRGRVVRRFRVSVGKDTTPTPTGRFAVTDRIEITGGSEAYGCCALALSGRQPNIEPGWRGGDRLAIHGTLQTWTIGEAASFGCFRALERDALWVIRHVGLGTILDVRA